MMYVIHKSCRIPRPESYSGMTWDKAGLRDRYRKQYEDLQEASYLAYMLNLYNPVGFKVFKLKEGLTED